VGVKEGEGACGTDLQLICLICLGATELVIVDKGCVGDCTHLMLVYITNGLVLVATGILCGYEEIEVEERREKM
jgi:hypothetical protein